MAKREYVKDLNAVNQLNKAFNESEELLNNMTGAGADLATQLLMVSDTHKKSGKYKKENLNIAKQQSTVGKKIIDVLNSEERGNKLSILASKAKLKLATLFSNKTEDGTKSLLDGYKANEKQRQAEKDKSKEAGKSVKEAEKLSRKQKILNILTFGLYSKYKDINKELKESNKGQKELSLGQKLMGGALAGAAVATGGITAGLGLIGTLLKAAWKVLTGFAAKVDESGDAFGVMGANMKGDLLPALIEADTNLTVIGKGLKESIAATVQLSSNFGMGVVEAAKLSDNILDSAASLGLSDDNAVNLFGSLMQITGMSFEQADNFSKSAYQLAQANKINPSKVMEEIATNTELFAKYGADSADSIALAANKAVKLGVGLKTVEKISNSLLDFQSSLTKEVEASVAIGRTLNLQKARELSLEGDLSGMLDEVLNQLGGIDNYNDLNVVQRRLLAQAVGMETDEMAKLVGKTAELDPPLSFFEMLGPDSQSSLTTLVNKVKELGVLFVNQLGPHILDAVDALHEFMEENELFDWAQGKVTEFSTGFKTMGDDVRAFLKDLPTLITSIEKRIDRLITKLGWMAAGAAVGFVLGSPFGLGPLGALLGAAGVGGIRWLFGADDYREQDEADRRAGLTDEERKIEDLFDFQNNPGNTMHSGGITTETTTTTLRANEAVIPLDVLANMINGLRQDMEKYFGNENRVANAMASRVGSELDRIKNG